MNPFNRRLKVVCFNLKTTSFKGPIWPVRLLQIGAVDSYGNEIFDQFVWPGHIPRKALRGSRFRIKGNRLHRDDLGPLKTTDARDALENFMECLEDLACGGKVILVAHHCGYHVKLLLELLQKFNIPYEDTIEGFCDSLKASRVLYPGFHHKLADMLELVGLPGATENDAASDAYDCLQICRRMAGRNGMKFLDFILDEDWYEDLDE